MVQYAVLKASVKVNPVYLRAVYGGYIIIARTAGATAMFIHECHFLSVGWIISLFLLSAVFNSVHRVTVRGSTGNFCLGGPEIQGGLGGRESVGTHTTLTKALDLQDYHKCYRSTLGDPDPRTPGRRRPWLRW